MTTADVDLQVIRSFPDIVAAMSNKSIDGGMIIEPYVTAAMDADNRGSLEGPSGYDPDAQTALLIYGRACWKGPKWPIAL